MKISELILILQEAQQTHGDLLVTGAHLIGQPEMTITHYGYAAAGLLAKSAPPSDGQDFPERFILDWEDL